MYQTIQICTCKTYKTNWQLKSLEKNVKINIWIRSCAGRVTATPEMRPGAAHSNMIPENALYTHTCTSSYTCIIYIEANQAYTLDTYTHTHMYIALHKHTSEYAIYMHLVHDMILKLKSVILCTVECTPTLTIPNRIVFHKALLQI